MRCMLAAALWMVLAPSAQAADIVVWMQPDPPDERMIQRADNKTGGTAHLTGADLAFPPAPASPQDQAAYDTLEQAVADGLARWEEFEVELEIAQTLDASFAAISIVRSEDDLEDLRDAFLFQGAAVGRAFERLELEEGERAAAFRQPLGNGIVIRAFVDAVALDPDRNIQRNDLLDGTAWTDFRRDEDIIEGLMSGSLDVARAPEGATVILDGTPMAGSGPFPVAPGRHWVHLLHRGVVSGRAVVDVTEGETERLPVAVDDADLARAADRIGQGTTTGFPASVKAALDQVGEYYGGQVFVAADNDGRLTLLPYARGARLAESTPVTVVASGEVGGGVIISPLFDKALEGGSAVGGAVQGGLGIEIGIYHFAIVGGFDAAFTPGQSITYGNAQSTDNVTLAIYPQPWGGLGAYILRPIGRNPTLLVAAQGGWNGPAHIGVGGRLSFGIPLDDRGTWFRITALGTTFPKSMWDEAEDHAMHVLALRTGFATRF